MMTTSVVTPCSDEPPVINRYYLHHHAPNHHRHPNRALRIIGRHTSLSALHQLRHSHTSQPPESEGRQTVPDFRRFTHGLKRKSKGRMSAGNIHTVESNRTIGGLTEPQHIVRDHALAAATCTKLRELCETCQHTVHKHAYLYCLHCPVVCHNRPDCITGMPRGCPSKELEIYGWGESRQPIKVVRQNTLDMDEIFLSALMGLQSNKCHECSCILNPKNGHELNSLSNGTVNGSADQENNEKTPKHGIASKLFNLKRNDSAQFSPENSHVRVCHMTGKYYCSRCHWDDRWCIPGSIILLNDLTQHPVCRSIYLKFRVLWDSAIYRSPAYWNQENTEANKVYKIRSELRDMRLRFARTCPVFAAITQCSELTIPSHLLEHPNALRMCDLHDIAAKRLLPKLQNHLNIWTEHVKACKTCNMDTKRVDYEEFITIKSIRKQKTDTQENSNTNEGLRFKDSRSNGPEAASTREEIGEPDPE